MYVEKREGPYLPRLLREFIEVSFETLEWGLVVTEDFSVVVHQLVPSGVDELKIR